MSGRLARTDLLYDGCYAHVISRSIRKLKIFNEDDDFETFKKLLIIEKRRNKFKIYHYCLMHTHFHIAVEIPNVIDFSRSLSKVKSQYASAFHAKYRLSGPIWRERYKSLLIENEGYLLACGQYIEENPVKAGLVERSEDWKYCSSKHYNQDCVDGLIDEYEDMNSVRRVKVEAGTTSEDFEKGNLIGSSFFKFQFFDRRNRV